MKLFKVFFLVLLLSSCSEDGDTANTDVVDSNFFNVDNIQAVIKERARHEDTVYEKIHSYLTSIDLAEGVNRRNNELLFTSIGIGGSKISSRCEVYSSLFEYKLTNINTDEFIKILDTNPHEELVNVKNNTNASRDKHNVSTASSIIIFINNVELEFESQSSLEISEVIYEPMGTLQVYSENKDDDNTLRPLNSAGQDGEVNTSEVFSLSTSIQLSSDFGDLSFSCDQEQTTVNDKVSLVERNGYFGLSPKTKTRFTNEGDYIEAYFDHMNDLGFKEIIFESGDVVGMVLQLKLKT